jgi:hypothetical protein
VKYPVQILGSRSDISNAPADGQAVAIRRGLDTKHLLAGTRKFVDLAPWENMSNMRKREWRRGVLLILLMVFGGGRSAHI